MSFDSEDFCYLFRVRYSECDAQKVVFNAKYAEYADVAMTEFMRAVWGSYSSLLDQGFDSQVVKLTIKWKAPARFDDVIAVKIKATHVGNTSFVLSLDMYHYERQELLAIVEIVYVMVSVNDHKKIPIPADMRKQIKHGAPWVVCDHAGVLMTFKD